MTRASSEETTVLATYTTRGDAEMARDYLDDAGIRAFVRADDAGGMYPQLQRPHGVKLVGMSGSAHRARETLGEAGLLPETAGRSEGWAAGPEDGGESPALPLRGSSVLLGVVALVLFLFALSLFF